MSKYKLQTIIFSAQATLPAFTDCGIYFSRIFSPVSCIVLVSSCNKEQNKNLIPFKFYKAFRF